MRPITIVNAKVFDGRSLTEWTSLRVIDDLIAECSAHAATHEGDMVTDAAGGTLLPGLIYAHVHRLPGALAQSLVYGVTTVLDMFSKPDVVAHAREKAAMRLDGADVRCSGIGATAATGHPSLMYAPFPAVDGLADVEGFVDDRIADCADYLKLFSGVGGRWPT